VDTSAKKTRQIREEIAKRIKEARQKQHLSLGDLAQKTGFAKSYLSQIENLKREPTIGTLTKIAYALGVDVFYLISGQHPVEEEQLITIVKPRERKKVIRPASSQGYTYESITYKKRDRLMDAYIVNVGVKFPGGLVAHEGQELVFVLEGKQEFVYNGKSHLLEKGDCCYFDSGKTHHARSIGNKPSKVLVVFTANR